MFYNASKKDVLIQRKLTPSEISKSFSDWLKSEIEEIVFESKPGAFDKVAEFDFVSIYPNIHVKEKHIV